MGSSNNELIFNKADILELKEIIDRKLDEKIRELRANAPKDKEPFNWNRFLELSYGDDFSRTPRTLEIHYYASVGYIKTLSEFVNEMIRYTYEE